MSSRPSRISNPASKLVDVNNAEALLTSALRQSVAALATKTLHHHPIFPLPLPRPATQHASLLANPLLSTNSPSVSSATSGSKNRTEINVPSHLAPTAASNHPVSSGLNADDDSLWSSSIFSSHYPSSIEIDTPNNLSPPLRNSSTEKRPLHNVADLSTDNKSETDRPKVGAVHRHRVSHDKV